MTFFFCFLLESTDDISEMIKFICKEEAVYCLEHVLKIIDSILIFILKMCFHKILLLCIYSASSLKDFEFSSCFNSASRSKPSPFSSTTFVFCTFLATFVFFNESSHCFLTEIKVEIYDSMRNKIPPRYILNAALAS